MYTGYPYNDPSYYQDYNLYEVDKDLIEAYGIKLLPGEELYENEDGDLVLMSSDGELNLWNGEE